MNPALARSFDSKLVRDDALFDAALVGLGAFGVLLPITIETEPLCLLEVHRKRVRRKTALHAAINRYDFSGLPVGHPQERPHHFGMVVNPYDRRKPIVTLTYKRPYRAE